MKARGSERSDVYRKIWRTVERIPRGKVATYGQIAALSGVPRHARLVGYALHNLPQSSEIPWHRVINAKGTISFRRSTTAHEKQKSLLEKEGVKFRNGAVDFSKFRWRRAPSPHGKQAPGRT